MITYLVGSVNFMTTHSKFKLQAIYFKEIQAEVSCCRRQPCSFGPPSFLLLGTPQLDGQVPCQTRCFVRRVS